MKVNANQGVEVKSNLVTGSDLLVQALEKAGVEVVFGYPGVLFYQFMMRCTVTIQPSSMYFRDMSKAPYMRRKVMQECQGNQVLLLQHQARGQRI